MNAAERFDVSYEVDAVSGCWLWTRPVGPPGYARIRVNGRTVGAHRFSYERFVGPIPEGLTIDHLCRTRTCVNPFHLEPVTARENVLRGVGVTAINARKPDTCVKGHAYSGFRRLDGRIYRMCKRCHYDKSGNPQLQRERRLRRKERARARG